MPELLDALGVRATRLRMAVGISIWLGFSLAMVGVAAAQAVIERAIGPSVAMTCIVVAAVWMAWTYWHSVAFGRHCRTYLRDGSAYPYRRAFLRDIFPGITIGFSQMLRPAWNGVNLANDDVFPRRPETGWAQVSLVAGALVALIAFMVFSSAWRTLGAARVGFVREFEARERYVADRGGPYGHIRHPLFWSGVGLSWSLALITRTASGVLVALLNTCYGLVYNVLEDRRMKRSVGDGYASYAQEVPRVIPRRLWPAFGHASNRGLVRRSGHATNGSRDVRR